MASVVDQALDDEVVSVLRRLDASGFRFGNGRPLKVIDFDLLDDAVATSQRFSDPGQAFSYFHLLEAGITSSVSPIVAAKIRSTSAVLREVVSRNQDMPDPQLFLGQTLHSVPVAAEPKYLDERIVELEELFAAAGAFVGRPDLRFDAGGTLTLMQMTLMRPDEVAKTVADATSRFVAALTDVFPMAGELRYELAFVERPDENWGCWSDINDERQFRLTVNLTSRPPWKLGDPERFACHEVVRFLQMLGLREAIRRGDAPRSAGLTTIYGPEAVISEGLADTSRYWLPHNPTSPLTRFWSAAIGVRYLVQNSALVNTMATGSVDEGVAEVLRYLPLHWQRDQLTADVGRALADPVTRACAFAYAIGYKRVSDAFEARQHAVERFDLATRLLSAPVMPGDLESLGRHPDAAARQLPPLTPG